MLGVRLSDECLSACVHLHVSSIVLHWSNYWIIQWAKCCNMTYFGLQFTHFLGFNCPVIFPFTGGLPKTMEMLNMNFQKDLFSFISFIQYWKVWYICILWASLMIEQLEFFRYLNSKCKNKLPFVMELPKGVPDGLANLGCHVMVTHNVNNELSKIFFLNCQVWAELIFEFYEKFGQF